MSPPRPATASSRPHAGFTLIEAMIVVVILGILATIAYANYTSHIQKAQRSVAKGALLDAATRQQQYFFSKHAYTADMGSTGLGYPANPAYFGKDGTALSSSTNAIYEMDAEINTSDCGGAPCFKLTATPVTGSNQENDSCGAFTLDSTNKRTPASACW